MKKRNRKMQIAAIGVSALMMFSTAAAVMADAAEEESIAGAYTAEVDMMGMMNEQMAEAGVSLEGELPVVFTLDLAEDETFVFAMDGEGFMKTIQEVFEEQGPDIVRKMLEDEGVTEENFSEVAEVFGVETLDEFIANMTDMLVKEIGNSVSEEMLAEVSAEGIYTVNGDEIILAAEETAEEDAEASSAEDAEDSSSSAEESTWDELKGKIDEEGNLLFELPLDEETTLELVFEKQ